MSQYIPLVLLFLACPLMMVMMMRGGHGHGGAHKDSGHAGCGRGTDDRVTAKSTDELRRKRAEIERELADRDAAERAPVGARQER